MREDIQESTIGIEHIDLHVGDLVCPAVLRRDEQEGRGLDSGIFLTDAGLDRLRGAGVGLARRFLDTVDPVNGFGIRIGAVVTQFVIHPIEDRDKANQREGQPKDTDGRAHPVFPDVLEGDEAVVRQ